MFCKICKIFFALILIIAFLMFIAYFILQIFILLIFVPQDPKFCITNASLTQFNFNTTTNNANTLHYNLVLNLTIRNPNKRVGIHYRGIQVIANYRKKRFATVTLSIPTTPFYQGHKNTTFLNNVLLQGQQVVKFGKRGISQLNKETAAGVYSIDVRLGLRMAAQYGKLKTWYFSGKFNCKLKVPLTSSSSLHETSGTLSGFKTTKCRFVSHYRHYHLL